MFTELIPAAGFEELPSTKIVDTVSPLTFDSVLVDRKNNIDSWRNYAGQMYEDLVGQAYTRSEALRYLREEYKSTKDWNPEDRKLFKKCIYSVRARITSTDYGKQEFQKEQKQTHFVKKTVGSLITAAVLLGTTSNIGIVNDVFNWFFKSEEATSNLSKEKVTNQEVVSMQHEQRDFVANNDLPEPLQTNNSDQLEDNATNQIIEDVDVESWQELSAEEIAYGRAIEGQEPIKMYTEPNEDSPEISNDIIEIRRIIPHRIPERYEITPNAIFRIKVVDDQWGQILPDNGVYSPFGDGTEDVFVKLSDFEPIIDLEPITINPETKNEDKQIIILRSQHPKILLLEGKEIIMLVPVALGGTDANNTNTPYGEYFISYSRGSRNMPGYPGVGFSEYIDRIHGIAIHDSYWWKWDQITEGFYGSAGCVNLPGADWQNAVVDGKEVPIAQFTDRWTSTNLNYNVQLAEEVAVPWDDPGYKNGTSTVRVVIVNDIRDLNNFNTQGSATSWAEIIESYTNLSESDSWVIPGVQDSDDILTVSQSSESVSVNNQYNSWFESDNGYNHFEKWPNASFSVIEYNPDTKQSISLAEHNPDFAQPAASMFKDEVMWAALFSSVPKVVWNTVPVKYWEMDPNNIPQEYRAHMDQYGEFLNNLSRMVRISDNQATSEVLKTIYPNEPIESFNKWVSGATGISSGQNIGYGGQLGMSNWYDFGLYGVDSESTVDTSESVKRINALQLYVLNNAPVKDPDILRVGFELGSLRPDGTNLSYSEMMVDNLNLYFNNLGLNYEAKAVGKDGYTVLDNGGVVTPDTSMIPVYKDGKLYKIFLVSAAGVNDGGAFHNPDGTDMYDVTYRIILDKLGLTSSEAVATR